MRRNLLTLAATACALAIAAFAGSTPASGADGLRTLAGSLHEHSAYSDGWPGTRPRDYYESAAGYGRDFLGGSDHSDNMGVPTVFSEACYGQGRGGSGEVLLPECALADQTNPADSFRKWEATKEQADQAMTAHPGFSAFRGFEWSSDRFGHISVYFSSNWTSAYSDGGFGAMSTFWSWFTRAPSLGGGSDGIATFNHPGAKKVDPTADLSAPGFNWDDFAYVPAADERLVGIEVFNDKKEYGSDGGPYPEGSYAHALDKGWHVGAAGAEDLGHRKPPLDNWGGPEWAKTVILASAATPAAIKSAMLARRFYAVAPEENALRLSYTIDGSQMGARLERPVGAPMRIRARASDPAVSLELVTSGGRVVAQHPRSLSIARRASADEGWYFVRARRGSAIVAYSSPVWVQATAGTARGTWLAGDLHVHTCYSHDAYCGPADDNTGPDTAYSSGGTVGERFSEAAAKGLDYVAITDHDDIRSQSDPDFGSGGVTAIPAYEASLRGGHAQMLGAARAYDKGDGDIDSTRALAGSLRADGGLFQVNHPSYRSGAPFETCEQAGASNWQSDPLHWKYGYSVAPDSVEVWNTTTLIPPSELYWECWLQRGARIGLTGGSDSHGANQANLGMPTTWVFASANRPSAILAAVRAGRTSISRLPKALGGARLVLEADADRDGTYEAGIGDSVPPGTPMRVRADGLSGTGLVRVRSNGKTLVEGAQLEPGGTAEFRAPAGRGWAYAVLYLQDGTAPVDPGCGASGQSIDTCSSDLGVAGMTSPIWIGADDRSPPPDGSPGELTPGVAPSGPDPDQGEPDRESPLPAGVQSADGAAPPAVPSVRAVGARVRFLSLRRSGRRRAIARWSSSATRFRVQRRRGRGHWRTLRRATSARRLRFSVARAGVCSVRVRTVPPGAVPGAWRTARIRF